MSVSRAAVSRRLTWLQEMENAYGSARYADAATIFDAHPKDAPLSAALTRARIFLKKDEPAGVIGLLASRRPSEPAKRAEVFMLLASAHARMRQFRQADDEFEEALTSAKAARDNELAAEIAYRRAVRFVQEKRSTDARSAIALAQKGRSQRSQIRAAEAESFLLASEAKYEEQARLLVSVLETLNPNSEEFLESRAWASHTLSILARELYLPHAIPIVERHLETGNWPEDLAINQFQGYKAVGWAHALRGDYFTGFRFLKRSLMIAPGKEWVAMAHADRAYLAQCNGERLWARQEIAEAEEMAIQVDWETMRGEEPIALLLIAELFAGTDPSRAAYYLARFDELGEVRNRLLHFRNDGRLKALADYSRAIVELALGNKKRGATLLSEAEEFFGSVRYDWRAGRCALELYKATGDSAHLPRAEERLRNYMGSWLGARLREYSEPAWGSITLPPMQRKVFDAVCRGLSNAEIAKELHRSEFTVANHVKILLKTFNVPSRGALLAEAVRRGIVTR